MYILLVSNTLHIGVNIFSGQDEIEANQEIFNTEKDGEKINNRLLFSNSMVSVKKSDIKYYTINNYNIDSDLAASESHIKSDWANKGCKKDDTYKPMSNICLDNWKNIKKLLVNRFNKWFESLKKVEPTRMN